MLVIIPINVIETKNISTFNEKFINKIITNNQKKIIGMLLEKCEIKFELLLKLKRYKIN